MSAYSTPALVVDGHWDLYENMWAVYTDYSRSGTGKASSNTAIVASTVTSKRYLVSSSVVSLSVEVAVVQLK